MKVYYHIDLNTEKAEALKVFLKENQIYFEPSQCYNLIHFEIKADEKEAEKVNKFLTENL